MFEMDGIDALLGGNEAEPPKLTYFIELKLLDAAGAEVACLTAESEVRQALPICIGSGRDALVFIVLAHGERTTYSVSS